MTSEQESAEHTGEWGWLGKNVPGRGNSQPGGPASRETLVFGGKDRSSVRAAEGREERQEELTRGRDQCKRGEPLS